MSEFAIHVVLDTSAIIAFAHESIAVGEIIAEVSDEDHGTVGLPHLCLVEAATVTADTDRLEVLVNNPVTRVVDSDPEDWRGLGLTHMTVGRLDATQAAAVAVDAGCAVLTARPGLYAGLDGDGPIIPF